MIFCALSIITLAGCESYGPNPPLVSAQSPPTVLSAKSEPQTLNSMPPGAANVSNAPGAMAPDYASVTLRAF